MLLPNTVSRAAKALTSKMSGVGLNVVDSMVFDYTYQFSSPVKGFPAAQVHADFTHESAQKRLALVRSKPDQNVELRRKTGLNDGSETAYLKSCSDDLAAADLKQSVSFSSVTSDQEFMKNFDPSQSRIIMLNAWVPLAEVYARPLIMCKVQSAEQDRDLFVQKMRFDGRDGEVYLVKYDVEQDWFYYPHMKFGEMLMLQTWNSSEDQQRWWTRHSGAIDPRETGLNIPRKSVEIRMVFSVEDT